MAGEGDACTARCGYCGMCTPAWARPEPEREPVEQCDICGQTLYLGRVSIQGVGLFCDRACADVGVSRHALRMYRRA